MVRRGVDGAESYFGSDKLLGGLYWLDAWWRQMVALRRELLISLRDAMLHRSVALGMWSKAIFAGEFPYRWVRLLRYGLKLDVGEVKL